MSRQFRRQNARELTKAVINNRLQSVPRPAQKPLWGFAFTFTNQAVAVLIGPKLFKIWVKK